MTRIFNFFKENFVSILKVLFGLFILYYIIYFLTPNVKISVEQKNKLDSLNVVMKQLHDDNLLLENKLDNFELQVQEVDYNIEKIKGEKIIIKEIYHEKISNVDKLSVPELDSFFSNRYGY